MQLIEQKKLNEEIKTFEEELKKYKQDEVNLNEKARKIKKIEYDK